ncbi:energy transducer TonB [Inhella sp.]|uniref:energy transducer TonB n=1 Tax=Inhella sp. TaxID=1921806 RepID=UPI0035AF50E4
MQAVITLPPPTLASPSRAWSLLAVLALHVLALLALAQAGRHLLKAAAPKPVEVRVVEAHKPPPPAPVQLPAHAVRVALPLPTVAPVPVPEFVSAQLVREVPVQPPPASPQALVVEPPPRVVSLAPPQPKVVSSGSLRYRVEPPVEVPRLSRRAGESGQVQLRVLFDRSGQPRQIDLVRGSGFARLDAQALEAMRQARIHPYTEDGQAIEVVALATLAYELD